MFSRLAGRGHSIVQMQGTPSSVMIEKFAGVCGMVGSEFLDLNHTSKPMVLVSFLIPKFAHLCRQRPSEFRNHKGY